jgi:hypothetical protein
MAGQKCQIRFSMSLDDESTQVLNFSSKLVSDYLEDRRRQFVVSYYLCDKTMAIFETIVPKSGFRGGKFLQRTRVRDPATKKFFEGDAFYVGARIRVSGQIFELLEAAPHTLCLMEAHADDFPDANLPRVIANLVSVAAQTTKNVRALFEEYDRRKTGLVSVEEARAVFSKFVPQISKHAVFTLTRAFDTNDGTYDYILLLTHMRA